MTEQNKNKANGSANFTNENAPDVVIEVKPEPQRRKLTTGEIAGGAVGFILLSGGVAAVSYRAGKRKGHAEYLEHQVKVAVVRDHQGPKLQVSMRPAKTKPANSNSSRKAG